MTRYYVLREPFQWLPRWLPRFDFSVANQTYEYNNHLRWGYWEWVWPRERTL